MAVKHWVSFLFLSPKFTSKKQPSPCLWLNSELRPHKTHRESQALPPSRCWSRGGWVGSRTVACVKALSMLTVLPALVALRSRFTMATPRSPSPRGRTMCLLTAMATSEPCYLCRGGRWCPPPHLPPQRGGSKLHIVRLGVLLRSYYRPMRSGQKVCGTLASALQRLLEDRNSCWSRKGG